MRLFWITMINIFLDTLSIVLLTYHKSVSELMIDIVCKSYLSTLILTGFSALLYICIDIYNKNKTYRNILTFGSIISVLGIILIFYSPIYKSVESSENIYTYGPSVLITYAFALAFLTINIILLICQKKKLNPIRRNAMCIWMFLWFLASGIQFFFKELLLVGFFSSLGIIITYLKLENPELNIDKSTGLFNREAMLLYMNQLLYGQKDFSLIELILPFSLGNHFSGKNSDSVQKELTTYLSEIKCAYPFVINDNSIVLIFEDKEFANRYSPAIRSRFNFGWGTDGNTYINLNWAYMPDGSILNKAEDIFSLLDYAKTNGKSYTKDNAIMITRKLLEDMHEEKNTERLVFEALEHNRVEVFYQPIYSTHHKRFTSAEALVRLRDNEDNIISPTLFIPVAEKNGSILQLGEIVFEKVCRFLKVLKSLNQHLLRKRIFC